MRASKFSQYLQSNEHLEYVDSPHWIYVLEGAIVAAILTFIGFFAHNFITSFVADSNIARDSATNDLLLAVMFYTGLVIQWSGLVIGLAFFVYRVSFYLSSIVFASNRRLFFKTGLIMTSIHEVSYDEIRETHISYGFFGRYIGYGKPILDARFVQEFSLPYICRPEIFIKLIHFENDLVKDASISHIIDGVNHPAMPNKARPTFSDEEAHAQHNRNHHEDQSLESENKRQSPHNQNGTNTANDRPNGDHPRDNDTDDNRQRDNANDMHR